jgi:hypothetical protein
MIENGKIRFRTFTLEIKKRSIPNSYLLSFAGGSDIDSSGWETPSGDRKKFEGDFKFMWNPLDAPSNKKGEYVVKFSADDKLQKFIFWIDNQIKQYGGVVDK